MVESLVRSGVGKLILVDFDTIDITNLNRQLMTNCNNIGNYKTDELRNRIALINKECEVVTINGFITSDNIDNLFKYKLDFFIDCCDTIATKCEVIKKCYNNNINLITCTGMGNRIDPTKVEIIELMKTTYDPISKKLRKFIKDEQINKKIICCASQEQPLKINSDVIGSNCFVPSTAGILISDYVIKTIIAS